MSSTSTASMQFTPEWLKPGRKQPTKQPSFSSLGTHFCWINVNVFDDCLHPSIPSNQTKTQRVKVVSTNHTQLRHTPPYFRARPPPFKPLQIKGEEMVSCPMTWHIHFVTQRSRCSGCGRTATSRKYPWGQRSLAGPVLYVIPLQSQWHYES